MLNRKLAHQNHYPAIDVLQSISRCMSQIVDKEHKVLAGKLKNVLATYNDLDTGGSPLASPISLCAMEKRDTESIINRTSLP